MDFLVEKSAVTVEPFQFESFRWVDFKHGGQQLQTSAVHVGQLLVPLGVQALGLHYV